MSLPNFKLFSGLLAVFVVLAGLFVIIGKDSDTITSTSEEFQRIYTGSDSAESLVSESSSSTLPSDDAEVTEDGQQLTAEMGNELGQTTQLGVAQVPDWPVQNLDFVNYRFSQYDDVASADLPLEPFLGPVINKGVINDLNGGTSPRDKGNKGAFRVRCKVSHIAYDDPIVYPGQVGGSHLHMFFGNTRANATSTPDSILNSGSSTCDGFHLNRSAYWVPTLHDANGDVVVPLDSGLFVYYKTFVDTAAGAPHNKDLELFPEGLRIVSGNVPAALDFQNHDVDWWCGKVRNNVQDSIHTQQLIDCPAGEMWMRIQFPYCWNGENTYDVDNPHLVPPVGNFFSGECPATHQKSIPAITYQLGFPVGAGDKTSQWFLSSDKGMGRDYPNGSTVHGDWMTGWNETANALFLDQCLRVNNECSVGVVGDNQTLLWPDWKVNIPGMVGSRIPMAAVTQGLCPGDQDSAPTDITMCDSRMSH